MPQDPEVSKTNFLDSLYCLSENDISQAFKNLSTISVRIIFRDDRGLCGRVASGKKSFFKQLKVVLLMCNCVKKAYRYSYIFGRSQED